MARHVAVGLAGLVVGVTDVDKLASAIVILRNRLSSAVRCYRLRAAVEECHDILLFASGCLSSERCEL